jgi:hypothetical protein
MLEHPLVERFLDVNCLDEALNELTHWFSLAVCPECLSKEIEIELEQILDDESYLVSEIAHCTCNRQTCLNSVSITRNLD